MNNYSKIYWLTRLDTIEGLFIGVVIVSIIGLILYYIGRSTAGTWEFSSKESLTAKERFIASYKWVRKVAYPLLISSALILTFLPTKNDMILIYAGGKTMDFVQNDSAINKIPYQTTRIISDYLDKEIKSISK